MPWDESSFETLSEAECWAPLPASMDPRERDSSPPRATRVAEIEAKTDVDAFKQPQAEPAPPVCQAVEAIVSLLGAAGGHLAALPESEEPSERNSAVQRVARVAMAEGETDVDVLNQHAAHLLFQEAEAILAAGGGIEHRARAASKMIKAACRSTMHTGSIRAVVALTRASAAANADADRALLGGNDQLYSAAELLVEAARQTAGFQELMHEHSCRQRVAEATCKPLLPAVQLWLQEKKSEPFNQLQRIATTCAGSPPGELDSLFSQLGADVTAAEVESASLRWMHNLGQPGAPDPAACKARALR